MYRLFLAIRYLLTRPINLLGIAGITIGVWALVVVVSLFSGFLQVVEEHVHAATADLVVTGVPASADWHALERTLRDDPNVAGVAARVLHYGLLVKPGTRPPPAPLPGRSALHGGDQPFLFVLGIDPATETEVTGFAGWITAPGIPAALRCVGAPLANHDGVPTVLVGKDRMQREGLRVGDPVLLTTAVMRKNADGESSPVKVELRLHVGGAFQTAHSGFDGNTVFVAADVLRRGLFPDEPGRVQEVAVRVRDEGTLLATKARLQRAVGSVLREIANPNYEYGLVRTWREKNAGFLASIEHQRALMQIVLIVIMVVAAFLMLATLSMMVTEKVADIGILTAMGGTPGGVTTVFFACGLVITVVGVVAGEALGIVTGVYLEEVRQALRWATGIDLFPVEVYNLARVPCAIEPLWLLQVAGMAIATGVLVSAIPAWRASRHDPLVSLRGS